MTVEFPAGALSADEGWPDSTADEVVELDANATVLFGIAAAYHATQFSLAMRTQALTRDMWARLRPVNDASLGSWMSSWDSLMSTASTQQARLTESYARTTLRQFGVTPPPLETVTPPDQSRVQNVEKWLDSDYADLDTGLHDEAEALLARLRGNQANLTDLARADRLPWLHSPVIRARTGIGAGGNVDEVFDSITAGLDVIVDAALRTNEFDSIANVNWPKFGNGKAMMAKRIPQAGACGWCRVVATRLYSLESKERGRAWHAGCRCAWVLVSQAEARTYSNMMRATPKEGGTQSQEGNYYAAAQAIGLWDGPVAPGSYAAVVDERFDPSEAFRGSGFLSRRTSRTGVRKVYDPASGTYVEEQGATR